MMENQSSSTNNKVALSSVANSNAKYCHQCRQKIKDLTLSRSCKAHKKNKTCPLIFHHNCLSNRYEKAEIQGLDEEWICVRCRGICNCSVCMRKKGRQPTAKTTVDSSVSKTGEPSAQRSPVQIDDSLGEKTWNEGNFDYEDSVDGKSPVSIGKVNAPDTGDVHEERTVGINGCSFLAEFIDDGSHESQKYYIARRTILEMLKDRGYAVPDSDIEVSLQEFRAKHGQDPNIDNLKVFSIHKDDPSSKIMVLFCSPDENVIRSISDMVLKQDTLSRLIVIVQNIVTSQALKALEPFKCKVEIFEINELLVNITRHKLEPKHEVLSNQEKVDLLEKYNINEKQLPKMLEKDVIARYYGLEKGRVVKVTYSGELTQAHVNYRCIR